MSRIPDVDRRLHNWARWKAGAGSMGGLGYGGGAMFDPQAGRTGYREAVIPTFDCEAAVTDDAVEALEREIRAAIIEVYLGSAARSLADSSRLLGCSLSAIHARVERGHRAISAWLTQRSDVARLEAARIASLRWPKGAAKGFSDL